VRDQVSHSYKTTGKIIVLNILIFKFSDKSQHVNVGRSILQCFGILKRRQHWKTVHGEMDDSNHIISKSQLVLLVFIIDRANPNVRNKKQRSAGHFKTEVTVSFL
jgi:hypothetical protein